MPNHTRVRSLERTGVRSKDPVRSPRCRSGSSGTEGCGRRRRCRGSRKRTHMRPTIRLGRVRGIEIGVHWSLLVIGVLLVEHARRRACSPRSRPTRGGSYWAAADPRAPRCSSPRSSPTSSRTHSSRCSHGQRVEGITLWLLGGVASLRDEAPDARSEFLVAVAGPATSIGLGVGFAALAYRPRRRAPRRQPAPRGRDLPRDRQPHPRGVQPAARRAPRRRPRPRLRALGVAQGPARGRDRRGARRASCSAACSSASASSGS